MRGFSNQLRLIKPTLGMRDNGLTQHELEVEDKLKSWMNNTPVYLQLQWFDTVVLLSISLFFILNAIILEVLTKKDYYTI